MKPKILVIVGPTASGKSDLAVKLAQKYNGEVISADSRQVYTDLDIGTGKITKEEMQGITHHLLDVADPKKTFTVVEWRKQAEEAISEIIQRGKFPIIAGGTGFYISTLIDNISLPDVPTDQKLRDELKGKNVNELFDLLKEINPEKAESLNNSDKNNPHRLIRAIEISKNSRTKINQEERESSYDPLWIGIDIPIEELRKKIIDRLDRRLNQGMIGEVKILHEKGLTWERMEDLGLEYRYIAKHLKEEISIDKMREKLAIEIGQYAKRQMTWFKRNNNINWFSPNNFENVSDKVKSFLGK